MATEQIFNIKDKIEEDVSISSSAFHEYAGQTGVNLNNQGEIRITIETYSVQRWYSVCGCRCYRSN